MRYPRVLVPNGCHIHICFHRVLLLIILNILICQKHIIYPSHTPKLPSRQPLANGPRSSFRDATAPCGARRCMPSVQWIDEFVVLSFFCIYTAISVRIKICSAIKLRVVKWPILRNRADRVRIRV